ncbi:putative transmembrane protein 132C-like [Triplophysa rosa]|uniref:Transmembrane protein 132C-like n=1 Tax=Triplophysa rosa TaxID=992332 RepID=A0A9W7WYJ8_TRIRA|nr:putative transmembrane protein 132C-like [Triplophysa rosa]
MLIDECQFLLLNTSKNVVGYVLGCYGGDGSALQRKYSAMPSSPGLPVRVTVPSPWQSLPLSQADLGLLFTNSSPFSSTQTLLLIPPSGTASKPLLHASFGSYSITQMMMSEPIPPLSPSLSASLLSKTVVKERKGDEGNRYEVRVLFHMRGDPNQGTCVTLRAFKQTEEQKASCITQPPLGLCVVTLILPDVWFETYQNIQPNLDQPFQQHHSSKHRSRKRGRWHQYMPSGLRAKSGIPTIKIHLYYSYSFSIVSNLKAGPPVCVEEVLHQSERQMYYIGPVGLEEERTETNKIKQSSACLDGQVEEKLWLDSNVLILYSKGPVRAGRPIRVSVNLKDNLDGESIILRLKVKKGLLSLVVHPVTNSDLWTVSVEKTTGSKHDVISIISHRTGTPKTGVSAVHQLACLTLEGLHRSFGVAMTVTASWYVEYSGRRTAASPHEAATSFFSFIDRDVVGIAPITESNTIINTAILTSQPVSLPVIVLAVGQDGKVYDVTSAVKCHSASEHIVKVSHDCSVLFVDGSESGMGSICVEVEFSLGIFSSSLCMAVWAPVVPLRVSLSDSVLSPIEGWSYYSENGCTPVYQRSTIQILARFSAQSGAQGGQPTYLLGSPDWFVDVTELIRDWLRIENTQIAALDKQKYLVGLNPGITSVYVISSQWDGILGSADLTVTSEPVSPGDLSVQLVGGLGLSVNLSPSHPSIVTATVIAHNSLYNHGQEASISVWIQFSDDTAILVSAFTGIPYSLRLSSLADSVVTVTLAPFQRILAQGDGGGPLVKAELLVTTCEQVSNHIELETIQEGSKTRRLAKGSGWIRVNLNMDAWSIESEESNFEMLDVTDMLVDSNKNLYEDFEDDQIAVNFTRDYDGGDENYMFKENDLEQAVLIPNHEDSAVYFSPGVEKERKDMKTVDRQVEIGIGAVLSLLCLSCLLFLINCLPSFFTINQMSTQFFSECTFCRK